MLPRRRQALSIVLALILVAAVVTPAAADTATERIRAFFAGVNRLIADPSYDDRMPERMTALRRLVAEIVDFRSAAVIALGPEWSARTAPERAEFARLFADLLQASVFGSVGARARLDNGLSVTYIGELDDRNGVTVATTVLTRSGSEMAVGYRMALRDARWMVHDVVIDGVSLVDNYRAQFERVRARSSYAGLVNEMRARLADIGRSTATASAAEDVPVPVAATAPMSIVPATPREEAARPEPVSTIAAVPSAPVILAAVRRDAAPVVARVAAPPVVEAPRPAPARVTIAAVAPRTAPPPVARVTGYWVQVGAFSNMDKAMNVVAALRDQAVELIATPDQPLMRVLVGPFLERAAAATKLREIRARGYDAFIAEASK
jgi:phospholipid transport system substrate-binding protein